MSHPAAPDPPSLRTSQAFLAGTRAAITSPLNFVTVGTFLGIGALAKELGFSLPWAAVSSLLIWAAPAQVIVTTALAGGSPLFEIAIAVALSAVRLMPMTVSLIPLMRSAQTRTAHLILPAHFVTVTTWSEGLRLLPSVARDNRVAFANGLGSGFVGTALVFTVCGFFLAAQLPVALAAGLLFLTPLAFFLSTVATARTLADRLALGLGLVAGPALAAYQVQLDLLWGGLIGGTIAYGAQRIRRALQ